MAGPGLNKVTLIGNLGDDPIERRTDSNLAIVTLSVATNEAWFNSETQERNDRTEWHRVVFFGRTAERVAQYLRKGSKVYVEGRLQTRKWTDQNQVDRYTTEVVGREIIFLDSRTSRDTQYDSRSPNEGRGYSSSPARESRSAPAQTERKAPKDDFADDSFDDLPW